jgi:hypothetical protein
MDDSEIQRLVKELDAAVTKDDAKFLIRYGDPDEVEDRCELIANRKGYLRAGIELLNAGVVSLGPDRMFVPISCDYLTSVGGLKVGGRAVRTLKQNCLRSRKTRLEANSRRGAALLFSSFSQAAQWLVSSV